MDEETIPKTISLFLLGIVDRVTRPFARPRLDLVLEGDVPPYLHTYPIWDAATGRQIRGRWYRVGILNHSEVPVSEVQVQLWKVEPVPFPIQPVTLHFKDDNPESGMPQRLSIEVPAGRHDPTAFADVLAQYEGQPAFEVLHTVPNVPLRHIPAVSTPSPFESPDVTLAGECGASPSASMNTTSSRCRTPIRQPGGNGDRFGGNCEFEQCLMPLPRSSHRPPFSPVPDLTLTPFDSLDEPQRRSGRRGPRHRRPRCGSGSPWV